MLFLARLVHADLSEYNVLIQEEKPVIIDVGQAVLQNHPKAKSFFDRDLRNLSNYFSKKGLKKTPDDVLADLKSLKPKILAQKA
jgi:RIO kinase 1